MEEGWSDLNIGRVYLPETPAIYIGVPETMNRSLLPNIVIKLQKVALEYNVNIYLYHIGNLLVGSKRLQQYCISIL